MSVLVQLTGKDKRNSAIGTPNGKYAPPSDGPFLCIRCIHFSLIKGTPEGECDHPQIIKDAEEGYLRLSENGKAIVHHKGCSEYFNNKYTNEAH